MALDRLKAKFRSLCIFVILLWITLPEVIHTQGICYKRYVKRSGRCRKKIFEGGRVVFMDFEKCCRRKDAQAWRIKVNGLLHCIVCPEIVDGGWRQWTPWSACPVTCDSGNQTRSRKCDNPAPQHGGKECKGAKEEIRVCYSGRRCPIDGKWGPWSTWLACSKSCNDGGVQFRSRSCDSPRPDFGGRYCVGSSEESRKCNENIECPVHGSWSSWNSWSACSSECTSVRARKCDNPVPKHGGKSCDGLALQKSSCPGYCSKSQGSGSGSGSEGSGDGSGTGSVSSGSGDNGIDIVVETGQGISKVNRTNGSKKTPTASGSGEGSGDGGSGSQIDDNEPGDNTDDDGSRKVTKSEKKNVTQVDVGSGESGYGEIDITVEKAPNGKAETKSSKKKVVEGSGDDGSASKIDDSESGDSATDAGSGKVDRGGSSKNALEAEGSDGEPGSGVDINVEKPSHNKNTVGDKDKSKDSRRDPGWGKNFIEIKG